MFVYIVNPHTHRVAHADYEQGASEPAKKKKKQKNTDGAPETTEASIAEVMGSGSLSVPGT